MTKVIETDSRGRISLKKLGVQSHSHYQVSVLPSGNVLLEPLVFKTALEATLENTLPEIQDTVTENQEAGYPVADKGHSTLEALLALED